MNFEIAFVLILILAVLVVLGLDWLPASGTAVLAMLILTIAGIITPEQAVRGFAHPATVTVAAMFVLSAGLLKTGVLDSLSDWLGRLYRRNFMLGLTGMMLFIGVISGFINNTAAVAILMPVVLRAAADADLSPSRLLMPLSFASMLGGVCTLLGTSTNILTSSIAEEHGLPAFGVFEFAPLGLVIFTAGLAYMLAAGIRLIPIRKVKSELTADFGMREYLTDIQVLPAAASVGGLLEDSPLLRELEVECLEIFRDGKSISPGARATRLAAGDVLRVACDVERLRAIQQRNGFRVFGGEPLNDADLVSDDYALVEAVVAPNSPLVGRTVAESRILKNYDARLLALGRGRRVKHTDLKETNLAAGDTLLIRIARNRLPDVQSDAAFVVVSPLDLPLIRRRQVFSALGIIAAVVLLAAFDLLPIMVAAVAGGVAMVLSGCISEREAYETIEWKIVFLLAGILSLGTALEESGGTTYLARLIELYFSPMGPTYVLGALMVLTVLLTSVISNNATAALLAPVAIGLAEAMGLSARPFLVAVTFGASLSFLTPIGYQTNTFIYGPGKYRFQDFLIVGTPLNVILIVLAVLLIPMLWPF